MEFEDLEIVGKYFDTKRIEVDVVLPESLKNEKYGKNFKVALDNFSATNFSRVAKLKSYKILGNLRKS